jgi:hypothetical protein
MLLSTIFFIKDHDKHSQTHILPNVTPLISKFPNAPIVLVILLYISYRLLLTNVLK